MTNYTHVTQVPDVSILDQFSRRYPRLSDLRVETTDAGDVIVRAKRANGVTVSYKVLLETAGGGVVFYVQYDWRRG